MFSKFAVTFGFLGVTQQTLEQQAPGVGPGPLYFICHPQVLLGRVGSEPWEHRVGAADVPLDPFVVHRGDLDFASGAHQSLV